ncbi:TetR/AcrR family transcriptional regulator [Desulfofundulus thermosubterraneus]|uniref:Transcriptional regulator, TetR family n=1 Tax=Desulfofundulus thermosubterraneus DSM 16057 TaxID=1121432 RepID=A0A1M6HZK8_9FIRM|nr:TetR/AcrR family transcriptional regulator [Desulfofundulus thermosubterraneus]SHJ27668.1 transcriptional regulator, TetR family [Desulfofundulus thermosubterraneus DSM 16057]
MESRVNRTRDAGATKARILEAARSVFAAKGYNAARVDEIVALARVNKRMVYHYYGSKEGLYLAVLGDSFSRIFSLNREVLAGKGDVLSRARAVITQYFYFLAANPDVVRLMGWETLQGGQHARRVLPDIFSAGLEDLENVLRQGVQEGIFRKDVDIRRLVISVSGLCLNYFSRREMLHFLWPRDILHPEMLQEHLDHVLDLVFCGILSPGVSFEVKHTGVDQMED